MKKIIKIAYSSKDGGAMVTTRTEVNKKNGYLSMDGKSYLVDECLLDVLRRFLNAETEYISAEIIKQ